MRSNFEVDIDDGIADGSTQDFKMTIAQQLESVQKTVNHLHDRDVSLLKAEVIKLRDELSLLKSSKADWQTLLVQPKIASSVKFEEQPQVQEICTSPPEPPMVQGMKQPDEMKRFFPGNVVEVATTLATKPVFSDYTQQLYHSMQEPLDLPLRHRLAHGCSLTSAGWAQLGVDGAPESLIQKIVFNPLFEIVSGIIIMANTLVMALGLQCDGMGIGYIVSAKGYTTPAEDIWPGAKDVFEAFTIAFTLMFCGELLLRFVAHGIKSVRLGWMWFDTIVVSLGVLELTSVGIAGVQPGMLRVVRLLRLIRLLKLFQVFTAFDSLFLLIKSIVSSLGALGWTFAFLNAVHLVIGIFLCQLCQDFLKDNSQSPDSHRAVFAYFGTYYLTNLTMFEITMGNWIVPCRLLVNNVHSGFAIFFILYRCMFCFAVLRVITAVFIAETNRVLENDDELTRIKKQRDSMALKVSLSRLFTALDIDGDGTFDWHELDKIMNEHQVLVGSSVGFDQYDLMKLFWLLDDGTGVVPVAEFQKKAGKLKGMAKAIDVQTLLKLVHNLDKRVQDLGRKLKSNKRSRSIDPLMSDWELSE